MNTQNITQSSETPPTTTTRKVNNLNNSITRNTHYLQPSVLPQSPVSITPSTLTPPHEECDKSSQSQSTFGAHLMLDLSECSYESLNCLETCFAILNTLPERIGMQKISAPHVFRYQAPNERESGITGVVIIAESHISLHTFPQKKYAFADIFSCKPFGGEFVITYFKEMFGAGKCSVFTQHRGRGFAAL